MKLLIIALALLAVAASLLADYKWKRWLSKQRELRERNGEGDRF